MLVTIGHRTHDQITNHPSTHPTEQVVKGSCRNPDCCKRGKNLCDAFTYSEMEPPTLGLVDVFMYVIEGCRHDDVLPLSRIHEPNPTHPHLNINAQLRPPRLAAGGDDGGDAGHGPGCALRLLHGGHAGAPFVHG